MIYDIAETDKVTAVLEHICGIKVNTARYFHIAVKFTAVCDYKSYR
ncbi:MAG: hypothetical protein ACI4JK_03650 [Oscillospiraceae bacterium]